MVFTVINMDIVQSRKLQNRIEVQREIKEFFKLLNKKYEKYLVVPIDFTLGDEWQIVFKSFNNIYDIIWDIKLFLLKRGIKVYTGIGIGTISTGILEKSTEMDGEAFINGREALILAKNKKKNLNSKNNRAYFCGRDIYIYNNYSSCKEVAITSEYPIEENFNLSINNLLNSLMENNEILLSKVTKKQGEIIDLYRQYKSYNKIVDNTNISSKAVISQRLTTAEYQVLENNKSIINNLFNVYIIKFMESL